MFIREDDFIRYITVQKGLSQGSVKTCKGRLGVLQRWLHKNNLTFNKDSTEHFLYDLKTNQGRKNNTLNTYIFTIRYIRDYLKDRGEEYTFLDEFKSFDKNSSPIIPLSQEELERLLNTHLTYGKFRGKDTQFLDVTYNTLNRFIAYTGCRESEAYNLKVKYLDLSGKKPNALFVDTKNKDYRKSYFTEPLTTMLKELIKGRGQEELVFYNAMGKTVHPSDHAVDLKLRGKQADITKRLHIHLLRHTYASTQYNVGNDIAMVATLIGHKDIQTTFKTYVKIADPRIQQATYRHPGMKMSLDPLELLNFLQEPMKIYDIDNDPRFSEDFKKGYKDLFYEEAKRLRN